MKEFSVVCGGYRCVGTSVVDYKKPEQMPVHAHRTHTQVLNTHTAIVLDQLSEYFKTDKLSTCTHHTPKIMSGVFSAPGALCCGVV